MGNLFQIIGWDGVIHLWEIANGSLVGGTKETEINSGTIPCLDVAYINDTVTIGTFNNRVKSYDLRSPNRSKPIEQYSHHKKPVLAVHIPKHHQEYFISASEDGSVALMDRRAKKVLSRVHLKNGFPLCMDMINGDNCLYVSTRGFMMGIAH